MFGRKARKIEELTDNIDALLESVSILRKEKSDRDFLIDQVRYFFDIRSEDLFIDGVARVHTSIQILHRDNEALQAANVALRADLNKVQVENTVYHAEVKSLSMKLNRNKKKVVRKKK